MELSFINPAFLWVLPLAGLPVIIHWLTRPHPIRLPFSAVQLLRDSLRSRLYTSRLREVLLLVLRCLLLIVVFLLFSRPVVHWAGSPRNPSDPVTAIILLDASYSMAARQAGVSSIERAVREARSFVEFATPQDRLGLVVFSDRIETSIPPTLEREKLEQVFAVLSPTNRPTRIAPALSLARQMLEAEAGAQKVVIVLSDLAENGWQSVGHDGSGFDASVRFVIKGTSAEAANAEISGVSVARSGPEKIEGSFGIREWDSPEPHRTWRILANGKPVSEGRLSPEQKARQTFSIPAVPTGGWGQITMSGDSLTVDDSYYFPLEGRSEYSVLVLNGAPSLSPVKDEVYYLAPVFDRMAAEGVRYRVATLDEAEDVDFSQWHVIVLANVGRISASVFDRLKEHLTAGRGLWVTAGNNLTPASSWTALLPGRLGPELDVHESVRSVATGLTPALGNALLDNEQFEWDRLRVDRIATFEPTGGTMPVLTAHPSRRPVLLTGRVLSGPVAFLTTTADNDWTNLPAKPLFPVICRHVLNLLARRSAAIESLAIRVGEPFEIPVEKVSGEVRIRRPDGITEPATRRGGKWIFEKTDLPGPYSLENEANGEVMAYFVANVDSESGEGNLSPIEEEEIEKVFAASDLVWVPYQEPLIDRFRERVRGKDLTTFFAALGFMLFSLESILTLRRRRGDNA